MLRKPTAMLRAPKLSSAVQGTVSGGSVDNLVSIGTSTLEDSGIAKGSVVQVGVLISGALVFSSGSLTINGSNELQFSNAITALGAMTATTFYGSGAGLVQVPAGNLTGTVANARLDAELQAVAGLTSAANKVIRFTGSGTADLLDFSTNTSLGSSDTTIPSQLAVKTYTDALVVGLLDFKGTTDASGNPNYPSASKGDVYIASVAGKVGGASGKLVDVGDAYLATADNAGGTEASVGTSWSVLEHNLVGAMLAANNLSDVSNVVTARSNLGLVIGTNVQAQDSELSAIAGLTSAADKLPYFTGSGTAALADFPAAMRTFLTTPSSANLGSLVSDDLFLLSDIELGAIAGLTSAADTLPYFTGSGTAALATFTAAGRALIDDADASAQRTTLGLGTAATTAATAYVASGSECKSMSIENPTSSDKKLLFYTKKSITISEIIAVLAGSASPSVTYSIRYGSDYSAAGTEVKTSGSTVTSVTSGTAVTSFNSATIAAGNYVWLTTTAKSGTVTELFVQVTF